MAEVLYEAIIEKDDPPQQLQRSPQPAMSTSLVIQR